MVLATWVAVASALTLVGTAGAAPPKPGARPATKPSTEMQVIIVVDSRTGCEPDCAQWIAAQGEITRATPAKFQRVFKTLGRRKLPIFISSQGGDVAAAYAIGREIRKRGLDVAVERTFIRKCEQTPGACDPRDGDKALPESIGAVCASSCVFILAAGADRVVPSYGFVGVHQLTATRTMWKVRQRFWEQRRWGRVTRRLISEERSDFRTVQIDPQYAPVRAYFTEMGIDTAAIMPLLQGTPAKDIHRMTPEEQQSTRIVTRVAAGDSLLRALTPAADPKPDVVQLAGGSRPATIELADVAIEFAAVYPPGGNTIDIFFRLKRADVPLGTTQIAADMLLADGKKLTARSTGGALTDPLHAALPSDEFCALRRGGNLSMKVSIVSTTNPTQGIRATAYLDKVSGAEAFAAKRCVGDFRGAFNNSGWPAMMSVPAVPGMSARPR